MNAVLMLVRNALELTKRSIASVAAQDIPVNLFCVDNDSTDGTAEFFRDNRIWNYRASPQLGVSKGWNYGLRYFFETGADYVLVVNNDIVARPDAYRELLADGGPFVTCVGVNTFEESQKPFVKAIRPNPDFSCFLIRREVWERVGEFDESMVFYASDADMHVRMFQAGITAYTIGLPFYHVASGTLKNANHQDHLAIQRQADLDRETFEKKWGCKVGSREYYALFNQEPLDSVVR